MFPFVGSACKAVAGGSGLAVCTGASMDGEPAEGSDAAGATATGADGAVTVVVVVTTVRSMALS